MTLSLDDWVITVAFNFMLQWLSFETGEILDTADKAHDGDITDMV